MAKTFISRDEAEKLDRLYAELEKASQRALAALRTDPPGHTLEGNALTRFMAADKKVAAIIRKIREIRGD